MAGVASTIAVVWAQTLGRSITDPDIFDNILKRAVERGSIKRMCIIFDELWIEFNTEAQADRLRTKLGFLMGGIGSILNGAVEVRCHTSTVLVIDLHHC